ncbi:MAG TPA: CpsB/CapC family capsule biosynthesis tyrosine phosphatase [Chitinophagaceae bacterium]|jgi:Capsular polysaccharide biosynthesis protein
MFLFKKKKPEFVDYSVLKTDIHSHLIPGIDDGSPDMETSIKLVKGLVELGYKKIYTTPHIMWDMYRNTREDIQERLIELRKALKESGVEVEIQAAAEYFIDENFSQLLEEKKQLLTIDKTMVLVEFSMANPPFELKEVLFEMQLQGYQPIIAHPERYIYLDHTKQFYEELKEYGCMFQLNLLSLGGYYGRSVQEFAFYLAKKEYYDLAGTDLHHARHLQALNDKSIANSLKEILDSGKIKNAYL